MVLYTPWGGQKKKKDDGYADKRKGGWPNEREDERLGKDILSGGKEMISE